MHSEAFYTPGEKLFARAVQQFPSRRPLITLKGVLFALGFIVPTLVLIGMHSQ